MKTMSKYVQFYYQPLLFTLSNYNSIIILGDNMKNRRIKIVPIIVVMSIILVIIIGGIGLKKFIDYRNSYDYKLSKIGYQTEEITRIKKLNNKQIGTILKMEYNKNIDDFIKQKYFIFDYLTDYLKYYKDNNDESIKDIVSIVNVGTNRDHYTKTKATDMNKEDLILVNKYNHLDKDYEPDDLVNIPLQYAYDDNKVREHVYEAFKDMWYAASKEDLTLIVTSSYRSYKEQEQIHKSYANQKGQEWADSVSARPGYSEHQTGLTLDIVTYNSTMDNFENTDEFKWLQKNSYKYGFILRYPKDKTYITGYDYESWHYRYVGKKVAKEIHDLDITYDEYYAYYLK